MHVAKILGIAVVTTRKYFEVYILKMVEFLLEDVSTF